MDTIFASHQNYASVYIDDIIFSENWTHHQQHLKAILQELRAATLTANLKKCGFGQEETQYLGFQIGQGRIQPVPDKVAAIRD